MCGVVGVFCFDRKHPIDREVFVRQTDALAHRGPDDGGAYFEPGIALGHRRLSIIDIGGGHQPMWDSEGRLGVVFNGAPDIYPVNHAVIDDTIVIRTAPGTKLVAAIDHQVAYEVDRLEDARETGWSVVVHGTAEEPAKIEDYLTALDDGPTPWAAGERDRFIVIRPTSVTGRVLPPAATGAAFSCVQGR